MKKSTIFGIMAFAAALLLSMTALASAAELTNTKINYMDYREIVAGDVGVVYKIKIANTGSVPKTYELYPSTEAVKAVGTYRIDPSHIVTVLPGKEADLTFYLSLEKDAPGRISIPLGIVSGKESTTIELAARKVGPFQPASTGFFQQLLKTAFFILLALIFIVLLIVLFRRTKKKEKTKNDESEVETYY